MLAPEQVRVLSLSEKVESYAIEIASMLKKEGFRAAPDIRNEKLGFKVREAEIAKVPYMVVVGEREAASRSVSVRKHGQQSAASPTSQPASKNETMPLENLLQVLKTEPIPA